MDNLGGFVTDDIDDEVEIQTVSWQQQQQQQWDNPLVASSIQADTGNSTEAQDVVSSSPSPPPLTVPNKREVLLSNETLVNTSSAAADDRLLVHPLEPVQPVLTVKPVVVRAGDELHTDIVAQLPASSKLTATHWSIVTDTAAEFCRPAVRRLRCEWNGDGAGWVTPSDLLSCGLMLIDLAQCQPPSQLIPLRDRYYR